MRLVDGAEAIRGDLPASATLLVPVPVEAGDKQETGIARYTSIRAVQANLRKVLGDVPVGNRALTIGGDCGVEFAAVGHAMQRARGDIALVWLDAHPDLNTPQSSPSGTFHGMVLRAILGDCAEGLVPPADEVISVNRVVLAGIRACDPAEETYIEESGLRRVSVAQLTDPANIIQAIEATGATSVYLHIDLDVLDPSDVQGVDFPEPFGVPAADLIAVLHAICEKFSVAGAGLTEFSPATPEAADDDLPTILRIIGALST